MVGGPFLSVTLLPQSTCICLIIGLLDCLLIYTLLILEAVLLKINKGLSQSQMQADVNTTVRFPKIGDYTAIKLRAELFRLVSDLVRS